MNSLAYSSGQLCTGVHLFEGYCYMGFSCRWLVSLTRGTDIGERACKSVNCKISMSKELQNKQSGHLYPCIFPEKDLCSLMSVKYCNRKSGNLGRWLHHWLKIAHCRGLPHWVLCYMKTEAEPASDTLCFSKSFRWWTKYQKQRLCQSVIHRHWSPTELNYFFIFCLPKKLRKWDLKHLLVTNISIMTFLRVRPTHYEFWSSTKIYGQSHRHTHVSVHKKT